jgi:Zn-dependent protease
MNKKIRIGRLLGISIYLHPSWFLVFGLITWSLASGYFNIQYPELTWLTLGFLGVLTSLLFFGSVLVHELGHSIVAIRNKIPVRNITLFIFGGVAQIEHDPRSAGAEFRIAIAGPLVSIGLAILSGVIWLVSQGNPLIAGPSQYLMRVNFMLALFNMIPGFPLDGGRVFRALVWHFTDDYQRATRVATFSGKIVAFGFIGFGIFSLFMGGTMNGLWLAMIGWFIFRAASETDTQTRMEHKLKKVTVAHVMEQDCPKINSLTPISWIVDDYVLKSGDSCFFIIENDIPIGVLTLKEITRIPKRSWPFTTARQAMVTMDNSLSIQSEEGLISALQTMERNKSSHIPVFSQGELVGLLSREHIIRFLRTEKPINL